MTNLEGRVLLRRRVTAPPAGVRTDMQILKALADRLGRGRYFTDAPARRLRRTAAGAAPAARPTTPASPTSASRAEDGVFWPCPSTRHPGTPRLFLDASPPPTAAPASTPSSTSARRRGAGRGLSRYYLTTGRVLAQYQSGTQTRRVADAACGRARALRRDPSRDGAQLRHRRRRHGPPDTRRGRAVSRRGSRATSGSTRCSCPSTGAARAAPTC